VFISLVALLASAAASPAYSQVTPVQRRVTARGAAAEARVAEAYARGVAATARVDTIVVAPAELRLRVGEELDVEQLTITARDSAGAPLVRFAPVFVLVSPAASFDGDVFRGDAPGEAELFIEGLPSAPPNIRPRPRPSTRIRIIVVP
jgi:hypothetical protein